MIIVVLQMLGTSSFVAGYVQHLTLLNSAYVHTVYGRIAKRHWIA